MKVLYYTIRCPRCKTIERVETSLDWGDANFRECSLCRLPIRVTSDRGMVLPSVRPHYKEKDDEKL